MCGIAGFDAGTIADPALTSQTLSEALSNRGPDGAWADGDGVRLVQTRLAIIDLSENVRYPMVNEDAWLRLVFNGEIYNHVELRVELEKRGHRFTTKCDAEVVLHGYEEWGTDVFIRLYGMFVAALVDDRRGEVVLVRDRFGIKPLAYTTTAPFAFASDAMALVEAGLSPGQLDTSALEEYLTFHYVPPPSTGITGIRQVEPGTLLRRTASGELSSERWAPAPFAGSSPSSPTPDDLSSAMSASLERHLVSDVELGVLLSGGLDSRLILAFARAAGATPKCFTITFSGHGDYDEGAAAAAAARAFGVEHFRQDLALDFDDALDGVATAFDMPFADSSAIATLAVARLAREHVKVVLTGTGGDDLFAGYYRHRAHLVGGPVARLPRAVRDRLAAVRVPRGAERRSGLQLAKSYAARLAAGATAEPLDLYMSLAAGHGSSAEMAAIYRGDLDPDRVRRRVASRHGLGDPGDSVLREIQAFECRTYLPGDLLVKEDRATMAFGLEGRVPMLDPAVLDVASRLKDKEKIGLLTGKRPLRKLGREVLPADLGRAGRKRGFAVPLGDLFAGSWQEPATSRLRGSESEVIDTSRAADMLGSGRLPPADAWAVAALVAWESRLADARARGDRVQAHATPSLPR